MTTGTDVEEVVPQPPGYHRAAVTLLMCLIVLSFLDRQIVNILAEPIKKDLGLADWQIGVMSGIAFAFLYVISGIPIARLADRGDRPRIIATSVAIWGTMTIACAWARTFPQLLLGRTGVGIGEAGLTPPAMSLIVDYSPPEKRASSLAHFHMGVPLGSMLGLVVGGLAVSAFDWRTAFVIAGVPSLAFALIAWVALREPRRAALIRPSLRQGGGESLWAVVRALWAIRSYRWLVLGTTFQSFFTYGVAPFAASFYLRCHPVEVAAMAARTGLKPIGYIGLVIGVLYGIAGLAGVWTGGRLADRFGRRDRRAYATIPMTAMLLSLPLYAAIFTTADLRITLALQTMGFFLNNLWFGPVHSTHQTVVPPRMRATATAVMLFVLNIIGLGGGPLFVGLMSDRLSRSGFGPADGLRWALVATSLVLVLPAFFFFMERRSIRADFANAELRSEGGTRAAASPDLAEAP